MKKLLLLLAVVINLLNTNAQKTYVFENTRWEDVDGNEMPFGETFDYDMRYKGENNLIWQITGNFLFNENKGFGHIRGNLTSILTTPVFNSSNSLSIGTMTITTDNNNSVKYELYTEGDNENPYKSGEAKGNNQTETSFEIYTQKSFHIVFSRPGNQFRMSAISWTGYDPIVIQTAAVNSDGNKITLEVDKDIDPATITSTVVNSFEIENHTLKSVILSSPQILDLYLADEDIIYNDEDIKISYIGTEIRATTDGDNDIENPLSNDTISINIDEAPFRPAYIVGSIITNEDGDSIFINFDSDIETNTDEPLGFTLTLSDGANRAITKIKISDTDSKQVQLTLEEPLTKDDIMYLSYDEDIGGLTTVYGGKVKNFSNLFVINKIPGASPLPIPGSTTSNHRGDTVLISVSQEINAATIVEGIENDFEILADEKPILITEVTLQGASTIALCLHTVIDRTKTVTVRYDVGENKITSTSGVDLEAFFENVNVENAAGIAPQVLSSQTAANQDTIILITSLPVAGITGSDPETIKGHFKVRDTIAQEDLEISSITFTNDTILLTLSAGEINSNQLLVVSYTGVERGAANEIQTEERGVLTAFSPVKVLNNYTGAAPVLKETTTSNDGGSIFLSFYKTMQEIDVDKINITEDFVIEIYPNKATTPDTILVNNAAKYLYNDEVIMLNLDMLTFGRNLTNSDSIVFSYLGKEIKSEDGGIMDSIPNSYFQEKETVTNMVYGESPILENIDIYDIGHQILLSFDRKIIDISDINNNIKAFRLTVENWEETAYTPSTNNYEIDNIEINTEDEKQLILTLSEISTRIINTDFVLLDYNSEIGNILGEGNGKLLDQIEKQVNTEQAAGKNVSIIAPYFNADLTKVEVLCDRTLLPESVEVEGRESDFIISIKKKDTEEFQEVPIENIAIKENSEGKIIVLSIDRDITVDITTMDTVTLQYIGNKITAADNAPLFANIIFDVIFSNGVAPPIVVQSYSSSSCQQIYVELNKEIDRIETPQLEDFQVEVERGDTSATIEITNIDIVSANTFGLTLDLFGRIEVQPNTRLMAKFNKTTTNIIVSGGGVLQSFLLTNVENKVKVDEIFITITNTSIRMLADLSLRRIEIYNINGKNEYRSVKPVFNKYEEIDITHLQKGIHILKLIGVNEQELQTTKFVKN